MALNKILRRSGGSAGVKISSRHTLNGRDHVDPHREILQAHLPPPTTSVSLSGTTRPDGCDAHLHVLSSYSLERV